MEDIVVKTYEFDNKIYYVVSEVDYNGMHYVYLVNKEDINDVFLRRINGDLVEPLDTKEEFKEVMKLIAK